MQTFADFWELNYSNSPVFLVTPLSTQIIHSKSVEFEPNSHGFFKICENLAKMWCLSQTPQILSQTPQMLVKFHRFWVDDLGGEWCYLLNTTPTSSDLLALTKNYFEDWLKYFSNWLKYLSKVNKYIFQTPLPPRQICSHKKYVVKLVKIFVKLTRIFVKWKEIFVKHHSHINRFAPP